ncbi:hypothetical protein BUALT_Bualt01G0191300 [Buddleja alternifolia]|uniref:Uncharacterized protein n=1 Tax=Buddleja alternifolia TaxID=168488 RepID=A0AAV6YGV6_9LAMI|nr:hypothetical protein BUALT_Bualt01G0191300 [Buddleja alternifolia]
MHQKKSEVQIGTESSGISSDFNPTPPLPPSSLTQKHPNLLHNFHPSPLLSSSSSSSANNPTLEILINDEKNQQQQQEQNDPFTPKPTPFKRPHLQQQFSSSLTKTPTLSNALHRYGVLLRIHSLRNSIFFTVAALLFSLNLAIPRLPTIRLFLARSLPIKISAKDRISRPHLPVFWSIGSRQKADKKAISGCYVQAYSNGDVYEGEFHKGKCSGSGFYTGDVYAGEWSNGQSHGCGIHTCEDGSRYVGEFKWGVKHGLGHYHFRNGDRYAGEYFADKMHGFGVYYFANGHRYEGAWHEGRRQGLGMYTFRNGETQSGHWQNGILDVPSTQSTVYPVSPVAVNHSKVLNVVQEARRATEKAYEVTKVDERVNRAVATANRAANAARVAAVKAVQKQMHHRSNSDEIPIPVV